MQFSDPPNMDLKDPNLIYKEDTSKLPYEEAPDVIDVDLVKEGEVNKTMRRYAVLSSVAYNLYDTDYDRASKNMKELLPLHDIDPELSDGYSSVIVKPHANKPNDVILSFRGTRNFTDLAVDTTQVLTGAPLEKLAGINVGYFKRAQDKYDATKLKYPNANVTTTGHSLGGTLGHYIGKNNNIPSYIFNAGSSPLDIVTDVGLTNTDNNKSTHYHVTGDLISASKALVGSSKDVLVRVNQRKWIKDLVGTLGAIGVGAAVGSVPGAIGAGVVASAYALFDDLHGLHNFLPPEAFKDTLDPEDILYSWIKPMSHKMERDSRFSKRTQLTEFNKPINKQQFIKLLTQNSKLCNPNDRKCRRFKVNKSNV